MMHLLDRELEPIPLVEEELSYASGHSPIKSLLTRFFNAVIGNLTKDFSNPPGRKEDSRKADKLESERAGHYDPHPIPLPEESDLVS